ncbi:MAG: EamA family transporter [Cyanobacteria bacterium J06648_11]
MSHSIHPTRWQIVGVLALGLATVSTAAALIRLALAASGAQGVGLNLVLATMRVAIASLLFLPAWRSLHCRRLQPQAFYCSGGAGIFLAVHFATWITSLSYTSIAASVTLVTTSPIWIALFAWIGQGERPASTTALGIGLGLAGSAIVSSGGSSVAGNVPILGNSLAVLGAIAASLYLLLGRSAQRRGLSWQTHAAIAYMTATLMLLPLPLLWGVGYASGTASFYGWALLLALGPQAIGHTSFNWAVRWISPTVTTLTLLLEPIGASALAFWIFGEVPEPSVFAGAGLTLAGVAIAAFGTHSRASSVTESAPE